MEGEAGQALLSYFGVHVNKEEVKHLGLTNVHGRTLEYRNGTVFSHLGEFFTTTVREEAERIWSVIVSGITSLAKWVAEEATKLWNSAVETVKNIAAAIANFLKKFWNDVKEFVSRFHRSSDNVKNHIADATLRVTDALRNVALGRVREVLKGEGYEVDKMSEEQLRDIWKGYMKDHPLTTKEEKDANDILNGESKINAVSHVGTWKAYIEARPLTPQEEAEANIVLLQSA